jgi:vacuolar-type H+-ATPase subunit I/STV1
MKHSLTALWLILNLGLSLTPGLLLAAPTESKEERAAYYRYVNDQGVKVMDHSIPPAFSQRGYEVLNAAGRVIKVVPPALTDTDIKALEARQAIKDEYEQLSRRYSSTKDIEDAKLRQLERLDANISIVRSNINSLKRQIDGIGTKAAEYERAAKPIPASLLASLAKTKDELASSENLMVIRQAEKQQVVDKFEREKTTFTQGKELVKSTSTATRATALETAK